MVDGSCQRSNREAVSDRCARFQTVSRATDYRLRANSAVRCWKQIAPLAETVSIPEAEQMARCGNRCLVTGQSIGTGRREEALGYAKPHVVTLGVQSALPAGCTPKTHRLGAKPLCWAQAVDATWSTASSSRRNRYSEALSARCNTTVCGIRREITARWNKLGE